jgi:putative ABC transport system permease protein
LRISLPEGVDLKSALLKFTEALRKRLDPDQTGFNIKAVKQRGLEASRGSTDFGEYFVYFSFFLIAAAILLAALFFQLGVEQRVREIGLLRSTGFSPGSIRGVFLREGAILSAVGSVAGLLGAMIYGWMMVLGLSTWWVGAVGTQRLQFHIVWFDLLIGAAVGIVASLGTIAWTLRVLHGNSPRALLAGVLEVAVRRHWRQDLCFWVPRSEGYRTRWPFLEPACCCCCRC